jgi:hypothetical protein
MKFRIYYCVYDAGKGDYHYWTYEGVGFEDAIKAPTEGVQVITQENVDKPKGYDVICQKEYYVWRPDQGWIGMNDAGWETYVREPGFSKYMIHGYNLRNDAYHDSLRKALAEGLGE